MDKRTARVFRQTLAATGCLAAAARAANLPLDAARRLRRAKGAQGAASSGLAASSGPDDLERAAAALETEAVRRALSGVEVPVFHQGKACGQTVKHSDQLLMFLLKTLKPARYGGGKDAATPGPARPVVLDIDLSVGEEGQEEPAEP